MTWASRQTTRASLGKSLRISQSPRPEAVSVIQNARVGGGASLFKTATLDHCIKGRPVRKRGILLSGLGDFVFVGGL
jgi:hypothetical protein